MEYLHVDKCEFDDLLDSIQQGGFLFNQDRITLNNNFTKHEGLMLDSYADDLRKIIVDEYKTIGLTGYANYIEERVCCIRKFLKDKWPSFNLKGCKWWTEIGEKGDTRWFGRKKNGKMIG